MVSKNYYILGVACGFDTNKDYPYLYFAIPYGDYFNRTVCVKDCPIYSVESSKPTKLDCNPNILVKSCDAKCDAATALKSYVSSNGTSIFKDFVCIFNSSLCK